MRCIFCKQSSENSNSVEHILPESLGNTKNILRKGIVCDKCNNYFSIKIEQPLLNLPFFKQLRARNSIHSKKNKIPIENLWFHHKLIPQEEIGIEFYKFRNSIPIISIPQPFASLMMNSKSDEFLITSLAGDKPPENNRLLARFLGKIGLEVIAQLSVEKNVDLNILINHEGLDLLRNYVRYDSGDFIWQYNARKIHGENEKFYYHNDLNTAVDILYGYHLFQTDDIDFNICVNLKGYELVLNMASPSIEKYIYLLKIKEYEESLYKEIFLRESERNEHDL